MLKKALILTEISTRTLAARRDWNPPRVKFYESQEEEKFSYGVCRNSHSHFISSSQHIISFAHVIWWEWWLLLWRWYWCGVFHLVYMQTGRQAGRHSDCNVENVFIIKIKFNNSNVNILCTRASPKLSPSYHHGKCSFSRACTW